MKILITGSSGMLGAELCRVLAETHELIGTDIIERPFDIVQDEVEKLERPGNFYKASITDAGKIEKIFDSEKFDLVIHAAAWTDVDGCEKDPKKANEVNTKGTLNIAKAAQKQQVPLVFFSTDFVFDGEKSIPYVEDDSGKPLSAYGRTKWEAEELIRKYLKQYAIVRTSWLYGKNGKNFVNAIIDKAREEKNLKVVNDQVGSPTYARDLAIAVAKLIETVGVKSEDTYHITNSGQCSWFDFAKEIIHDVKDISNVNIEAITSDELGRPATRPHYSVLDNGKFEKLTEHKMRTWQEALKEYIKNECRSR